MFLIFQPEKVTLPVCVFCALIFFALITSFCIMGMMTCNEELPILTFLREAPPSGDLFKLPDIWEHFLP